MSRPTFAFIIVNYQTPQLVIDCIQTIATQVGDEDEIIVVDNASADDTIDVLTQAISEKKWEKLVTLIQAPTNGGFSAGNNLGMRHATADAFWLTNSDTLFLPGAIELMRQTVAAADLFGLYAPRLEWPDGRAQISTFRYHTPLGELLAGANTGPITKRFPQAEVPIHLDNFIERPDWASFASIVVRKDLLERVGGMDEGFFMYFEDVDYCKLATESGLGVFYVPECKVVHLRGGTSDVKAKTAKLERRPSYYYAARSRYFAKHFGRMGLWRANLLWTLGRGIAWIRETFGSKAPHTCKKESIDIWTNAWQPLDPYGGAHG